MLDQGLSPSSQALLDLLKSLPGRSYALLDAACSQGLMRWIDGCSLPIQSLYSGTSAVTLREQAPYLVELDMGQQYIPAVASLLEHGWGQHLMLLIKSQEPFENLRIQLKKKLVVRNEQGRRLYFRFYDPRVARSFLATSAHEGLELYFQGDITAYIIESVDAQAITISRSSRMLGRSYDSHTHHVPAKDTPDEDETLPPMPMMMGNTVIATQLGLPA